jgi:hypothetical protein
MPKRGQQAAWIESMAKSQMGVLDMICRGGDEGLRIDDEVGPIAPTSGTGSQGPVVSNPKVEPGKGISWS